MLHTERWSLLCECFLIFIIIFSPLFYAAAIPLSAAILQFACLLILLLFIAKLNFFIPHKILYPPYLYFIVFFICMIILQIIPFPVFILKLFSPNTVALIERNVFSKTQGFLQIAFYTLPLKEELVKFFSVFAVFFITMNILEKKQQFQRIILVIIFLSLALSFYGIFKKYNLIGIEDKIHSFSTFGNGNHFAGYMVMVVPLTIGFGLACRNILVKVIFGFIAAIISASIFLSLSRAGTISLLVSLTTMCYLLFRQNANIEKYGVILLVIVISIFLLVSVGFASLQKVFILIKEGLGGRFVIVRDSFAVVRDFPLFGVGLGNFSYIFPLYQTFATYPTYYKYLHNEYLQMIVECGLFGALSYFLFIFKILKDLLGQLFKRRDPFVQNIVLGGWSGLIGILFHSLFEFNFHIPAVALLFWLMIGLIYKCAYTHFFYSSPRSED